MSSQSLNSIHHNYREPRHIGMRLLLIYMAVCKMVDSKEWKRMIRNISFTLNGKPMKLVNDDERMLLWVLRYDLCLTGTKFGCGAALCGSCTVIVDRDAV